MKANATFRPSEDLIRGNAPASATVVAIVQARMGSTRLPGKSLAEICGRPMLWHVVARARRSRLVSKVVVATTDQPADDPIALMCRDEEIPCFRGSEDDVLDRFYRAAQAHSADVVVRITADCPLIDPAVIDEIVSRFKRSDCDYVSNTFRYTFPDGLDTEVFSFEALERAWREARKPSEREHVTPYLRTGRFRTANVESDAPVSGGRQRWTVDHPLDLEFVRGIYAEFSGKNEFGFHDVLDLLRKRPDLATQTETVSNQGYYRSLYSQAVAGAEPRRHTHAIPSVAGAFAESYSRRSPDLQQSTHSVCRGCSADFFAAGQRLPGVGRGRERIYRLRPGLAAEYSRICQRRSGSCCSRSDCRRPQFLSAASA